MLVRPLFPSVCCSRIARARGTAMDEPLLIMLPLPTTQDGSARHSPLQSVYSSVPTYFYGLLPPPPHSLHNSCYAHPPDPPNHGDEMSPPLSDLLSPFPPIRPNAPPCVAKTSYGPWIRRNCLIMYRTSYRVFIRLLRDSGNAPRGSGPVAGLYKTLVLQTLSRISTLVSTLHFISSPLLR